VKLAIWIALFAVAFLVSAFAALFGMGAVAGRDIGFAGGGLWFVMAPAALVGTLLAYPASRLAGSGPVARPLLFLVASPILSAMLAALPFIAFEATSRATMPDRPEDGVVYLLDENETRIDIKVDRFPAFGKPTALGLERRLGKWIRVRAQDAPKGRRVFARPLSPRDPALLGKVTYEWKPPECMSLVEMDAATGEGKAIFHDLNSMGGCEISAAMVEPVYGQAFSPNPVNVTAMRK
jgi:hypothetical protein